MQISILALRFKCLSQLQKKIIIRGFDLLKEGGEMIYSTCTYDPNENESVVDHLLKQREAANLLPIENRFPHDSGIEKWNNEKYDSRMSRTVRFYPHRVDAVGFFVAKIGKGV